MLKKIDLARSRDQLNKSFVMRSTFLNRFVPVIVCDVKGSQTFSYTYHKLLWRLHTMFLGSRMYLAEMAHTCFIQPYALYKHHIRFMYARSITQLYRHSTTLHVILGYIVVSMQEKFLFQMFNLC
jgi:hypothetical protein